MVRSLERGWMHNQDRDPLIGKMLQASSVSRHANPWRAFLYALHCNPFVKGGRPQPLGRSFEAYPAGCKGLFLFKSSRERRFAGALGSTLATKDHPKSRHGVADRTPSYPQCDQIISPS